MPMARFDGYLYTKLSAIGSRSEGPAYILQLWDGSEIPVIKKSRPWQGDRTLHPFVGQKVMIQGTRGPEGIQYQSVAAFLTGPVVRPMVANPRAPTAVSVTPTSLSQGAFGLDVRRMQARLAAHGYNVAADGYFGSPTRAAIEHFQSAHGLRITGEVDPATLDALG